MNKVIDSAKPVITTESATPPAAESIAIPKVEKSTSKIIALYHKVDKIVEAGSLNIAPYALATLGVIAAASGFGIAAAIGGLGVAAVAVALSQDKKPWQEIFKSPGKELANAGIGAGIAMTMMASVGMGALPYFALSGIAAFAGTAISGTVSPLKEIRETAIQQTAKSAPTERA